MKIQNISKSIMQLSAIMLLLVVTVGSASAYTYDVSEVQPWSNESTTESNVDYVSVRSYVPGSNYITYKTIPIYSSTTTSGTNSLGDVVGYTNNIYGTSPAFVDPYDGAKYSLEYPTYQLMKTRLYEVNDQRLATGDYMQTGAIVTEYIYDLIYKKYTTLSELNSKLDSNWTHMSNMNNHGQIVGTSLEGGFSYDCQSGQSVIDVVGSTWTKPQKIDDLGNVYGTFSHPDMTETYFIATPDTPTSDITCSLIRDDVFEPIVFGSGLSFEMSGDSANAMSVADFSGDGITDILVDHGEGKVILYLGEEDFDSKIKYYGESFSTIFDNEFPDVVVPADVTDVNNDGIDDSIITDSSKTQLSLGKGDGTYYYVPQTLNKVFKFADMNNDGFSDIIRVNVGFISVQYQQQVLDTTPVDPTPVDTTTPIDTTNGIPAISPDAEDIEFEGEISSIGTNNYVIDGKTVWITADTIFKVNGDVPIVVGLPAQVKGMQNPDGGVVGIKVELN